jgi:hypothetical protein
MFRTLPPIAVILGIAGLLPFIAFGLGSVGSDVRSDEGVHGLIAYGGIILSFLGGVHWGFTLSRRDEAEPVATRLVLGVVPAIVGWVVILLGIVAKPVLALALLIAGFIALVVAEHRAQKFDIMPSGYMAMRWVISVLVVAVLTTVLVLRLAGARILL